MPLALVKSSPWKLLVLAGSLLLRGYAQVDSKAEYVAPRVCASCHRQVADDYRKTGMGRSFFRPTSANIIEDYTRNNEFYHSLSDTHYSMIRRDGEFYQRRWQIGFAGKETNVEEMKVDYILGSGNHARSYLHRTAAGTLIELPLGWYPDPDRDRNPSKPEALAAGSWAMSPGSDSDHPRTRRFIAYKCMFCHNGIPRIPAGHEVPGSDPVFLGDLPEGIDCQRCHGPGGKHVRAAGAAGGRVEDIRGSIVNPARLSSKLRMEVCMQCHLETTSGRIPAALQRFNRGPFSFVPGEPLEDFVISFDHAPGTGHDDKFEAVSSVYRLRQSRCFAGSEGKLTCQTCHNPHRAPRGEEAKNHYSAICRQCHATRQNSIEALDSLISSGKHPAATDCIPCHMPKRPAEDTPRMIMTDHLIQRSPVERAPVGQAGRPVVAELYHGEVVPYYPSPLPQTDQNALYRAVAQVGLGNNVEAGLPELARETERQKPREAEFYIVLGDAWKSTGKQREAVAAYEQAVRLSPGSLRGLRALAGALQESGERARAAEILKKAIEIAPSDAETWYRYGMLDSSSGRMTEAIDKIQKAISLDPSLPEKSRRLAEILAKAGKPDRAQAVLRDALRIDPYDEDAWDLAGRILSEKGEIAEAIFDFERAIRLRPGSAPHLYDYALALARADRFDQAQERAEAALRADANLAEAHELLGGLFERKRQLPEAAREYRRALELRQAGAR
jgi:predicted CXXCH cytochrome family protein